jgi:hypothetical protein
MTDIPQSPFLSADQYPPAGTAVAIVSSPSVASAELLPEPSSSEGRSQGAPAIDPNPFDAGATDCIHELFHFARKLIDEDHRFILDEEAFMAEIEPLPLFMQRAMG